MPPVKGSVKTVSVAVLSRMLIKSAVVKLSRNGSLSRPRISVCIMCDTSKTEQCCRVCRCEDAMPSAP